MYTLNITAAVKQMSVNKIREFIFENNYKRIGFSKENSYYSMKHFKKKDLLLLANKLIEKISDPCNGKKHYQSFIRMKNKKSIKRSEIITYQLKTFENPNIVDIKAIITEHSKASHILLETIKQAEKVGSNSSLYSDKRKRKYFKRKKSKNNKTKTCF